VNVLEKLGISLLVTTYQAGKVIALRASEGKLNTHFRTFRAPMGLAADRRRLAVGTKTHVWEFRNQPQVGQRLEPVGKHDSCYLPRAGHVTGDIRIHEIAFAENELWIVNTRFSCLCTIDRDHSFVPKWRPNFVTALAPEDRCHLNGMALVDGKPRYVTCLGKTDTPGGWRDNKAQGGMIIDVKTHDIYADGLSMPHSPRWYKDKLWVMESGDGNIGWIDPKSRKVEKVAQFPGFTRGLDFYQNLAFIGLSQVRESAVFSGIPLTDRLVDRACGIWVMDINSGKTVAFLRFDSGVQEIFAVQVLPGIRYPEIIIDDDRILSNSFVLPDFALKDVPRARMRQQQQQQLEAATAGTGR